MSKTKKALLITISAVVILIAVAAIIFATTAPAVPTSAADHISLAENYLLELNYEAAIAEYRAAIQIDPKNADYYIALAEVYVEMGDIESVIDVLEEGFAAVDATNSNKIREMLNLISPPVTLTTTTITEAVTTIPPEPDPFADLEELSEVTGNMTISEKKYKLSGINTVSADETLTMLSGAYIHIIDGGELIVDEDALITIGDSENTVTAFSYIYIENGGKLTVKGNIISDTNHPTDGIKVAGIEVRDGGILNIFDGNIQWEHDSEFKTQAGAILNLNGNVPYQIFESSGYGSMDRDGKTKNVHLMSETGAIVVSPANPELFTSYPLSFRYILDSDVEITTDSEINLGSIVTNGHTVILNCGDGFGILSQYEDVGEWTDVELPHGVVIDATVMGQNRDYSGWGNYLELSSEEHEAYYELRTPGADLSLYEVTINSDINLTMDDHTWIYLNSGTVFGETGMIKINQIGDDEMFPTALCFTEEELTVYAGTFGTDINVFLDYLSTFNTAMFSSEFTIHFIKNDIATDYPIYYDGNEFSLTDNRGANPEPLYISPNMLGWWTDTRYEK
jgi:tetratricopeptide (TPR) repeat protein